MALKDPYIYEGSDTLINLLGIRDYETLKQAEADIGLSKIINAHQKFSSKFDVKFIQDIHEHIFEDIFEWAGKFRTVPIHKTEIVLPGLSLAYSEPSKIQKELEKALANLNEADWDGMTLDEKSMNFTRLLARLWKVHPFRDGNTRTMMTFGCLFAREHGFPLDINKLVPHLSRTYYSNGKVKDYSIRDKFVLAALDDKDYPEPQYLNALIKSAITDEPVISNNIEDAQNKKIGEERE